MKNFKITFIFIFALTAFCFGILYLGLGEDIFVLATMAFKAVKTFLEFNWPYALIIVLLIAYVSVKNTPDTSEMNARVRYAQADEIAEELADNDISDECNEQLKKQLNPNETIF